MSWVGDREITYVYVKPDGSEVYLTLEAKKDPPDSFGGGKYAGHLPDKTAMTFKIQFERNGRIGYKYDTGNGRPRITSATRERYEHFMGNTGGDKLKKTHETEKTKTVYSKGFERHLNEQRKKK